MVFKSSLKIVNGSVLFALSQQLIGLVGCGVPTHLKAELLRTLAALARYIAYA